MKKWWTRRETDDRRDPLKENISTYIVFKTKNTANSKQLICQAFYTITYRETGTQSAFFLHSSVITAQLKLVSNDF